MLICTVFTTIHPQGNKGGIKVALPNYSLFGNLKKKRYGHLKNLENKSGKSWKEMGKVYMQVIMYVNVRNTIKSF